MTLDAETFTGIAVVAGAALLLARGLWREWREESADAGCGAGCPGCTVACAAHPKSSVQAVAFVPARKEDRS